MHLTPFLQHALYNTSGFLIVAHFVQSFPTPDNKYGAWLVGSLQWLVGQRERAINTLAGHDTATFSINKKTGEVA